MVAEHLDEDRPGLRLDLHRLADRAARLLDVAEDLEALFATQGAEVILLKGGEEIGRTAIDSTLQPDQNYELRMRLDHGSAVVGGRKSPLSLYDKSLATYDEGDAFDHASAVGFIEIFGLPLRVEAARHGAVGARYGAAWSWTDPLLETLPTTVTDPEPAAV
jgi:hypothetical protein